jgi:hypothetical protein
MRFFPPQLKGKMQRWMQVKKKKKRIGAGEMAQLGD